MSLYMQQHRENRRFGGFLLSSIDNFVKMVLEPRTVSRSINAGADFKKKNQKHEIFSGAFVVLSDESDQHPY